MTTSDYITTDDGGLFESKIICQSLTTGTYRYTGSQNDFSVNKIRCLSFLRIQARNHNLTQSRICFHENDSSILQFMLVYHSMSHQVRRHMHPEKDEYLLLVDGSLSIRFFSNGDSFPSNVHKLCECPAESGNLFCFIPRGMTHDVILNRDSFFIEATTGPFSETSTIYTENQLKPT